MFLCVKEITMFLLIFFSFSFSQVSNALDIKTWMVIILLPIILLSFIRDLRTLAPFSIAANICCIISLVIIFQYIVRNIHHTDKLPAFAGWSNLPVFFGITLYTFEGIGVVCVTSVTGQTSINSQTETPFLINPITKHKTH